MTFKDNLKKYWWVFAALIVLVLVVVFFTSCESGSTGNIPAAVKKVWDDGNSRVHRAEEVRQTTPKGATVISRKGLSQKFLDMTDEALEEVFLDAQAEYPGEIDPYAYNFKVYDIYEPSFDCIPSPIQQIPGFYVRDGSLGYDGTQFDQYDGKDGKSVVMAPERVFSFTSDGSTPRRCQMLVCPTEQYWKDSVRHGAEHSILNTGTTERVLTYAIASLVHTTYFHPLIKRRNAPVGLVAKPSKSDFAPVNVRE